MADERVVVFGEGGGLGGTTGFEDELEGLVAVHGGVGGGGWWAGVKVPTRGGLEGGYGWISGWVFDYGLVR